MSTEPILYSFRRCPYAMRGRMGLMKAGIRCEIREIILRDKPEHMLQISPKGSVPVLLLPDGNVIDESLDIMLWALEQNDPDEWLKNKEAALDMIAHNDSSFKAALDRYKYPNRFPDEDCSGAREDGLETLERYNNLLTDQKGLNGDKTTLADIAIFPFVRQFAHVDREWFYVLPLPHLQAWLRTHLESALFKSVMLKYKLWSPDSDETYIN